MAIVVAMMIVMAMDADAHANATNMNADNGSVRRAGTQQGEGENRGNERFHGESFVERASPLSPHSAWMAVPLVRESRYQSLVPDRTH